MRPLLIGGIAAAALVAIAFGTSYTIDEGERGVLLRNGAVVGTAEPGRGFKVPLIDSVARVPISQQSVAWIGETALHAYSNDQQPATIAISVIFHVPADRVNEVYIGYGGMAGLSARLLDRVVPQQLKIVFGRFNAVTAIQNRDKLNAEVQAAVVAAARGPVVIDSVQIENIDFSDAYEQSIEARMLAEVEVQKLRQNAEREKVQAEITMTQAQAQASAALAQAEADAEAIRLRGEAEAKAIRARGEALRDNPNLVMLVQAEKWNGVLPTTMVPGGAVPFLKVEKGTPME